MKLLFVLVEIAAALHFSNAQTITWQSAGTLSQGDFRSILGTPWGYVFAGKAGPAGGLMLSTNNGLSWLQVGGSRLDQVNCLIADETNSVFAGLSMFGVARSTDSGYTWATRGLVETEVFALGISRTNLLIAGTWRDGVFRSTDEGASWEFAGIGLCPLPSSCPVKSFAFDSSGTIFCAPQGIGIYYSTNDGSLWLPLPSPTQFVQALSIHRNGAFFAGTGIGIFRTTDHGTNWEQDSIGSVTSIAANSLGHLFAGTSGNGVFRSTDEGNSWQAVNSGLPTSSIKALTVTTDGYVFIATNSAGVFRTVESTTSARENGWQIPVEVTLKQNYPNPFNPVTTIEYELPQSVDSRLVVIDILGRVVSVLQSGRQSPGRFRYRFDASHLSSGVYFYRLEAGSYTQMRRMLIVR
jgi:hypothetical protein